MRDRHVFRVDTTEMLASEMEERSDRLEAQREALWSCLSKLPVTQRELVDRAYGPEARIDNLARRLGLTDVSLYKKLQRVGFPSLGAWTTCALGSEN